MTTAEPSTTTDQQTGFADTETMSTSVEMMESEQPEVIVDTQTSEQQQILATAVVDPSQIQEAESIAMVTESVAMVTDSVAMVTDSIAAVTGTDDDMSEPLPQQSGDLAADTTSGAPDSKSELSLPQEEAQVR